MGKHEEMELFFFFGQVEHTTVKHLDGLRSHSEIDKEKKIISAFVIFTQWVEVVQCSTQNDAQIPDNNLCAKKST